MTVEIKKITPAASWWKQLSFEAKRNLLWIVIIVLLVAIIVILSIAVAKVAKHGRKKIQPTEIRLRTMGKTRKKR